MRKFASIIFTNKTKSVIYAIKSIKKFGQTEIS